MAVSWTLGGFLLTRAGCPAPAGCQPGETKSPAGGRGWEGVMGQSLFDCPAFVIDYLLRGTLTATVCVLVLPAASVARTVIM